MALQEEFERDGNWLFRWRSYLPLVILALSLAALPRHQDASDWAGWDRWWGIVCLLLSFVGLGIRALTLGYVARRTSGRNTRAQRADSLNMTGMYSIVRHPLYLGNAIAGLGVVLITRSWWMTLIYVLAFWIYYERIMFAEEEFLRKKFSDEFTRWGATTPAFIPRFRGYVKPHLPFSTKTALKREYNGAFAIILVLFILEVASDAIVEHRFECDLFWKIILGVGFGMWMVLRTLKKKTTLLRVQGR